MLNKRTKKNFRRKKRQRKTRCRKGSGLSSSKILKSGVKALAASSVISSLNPEIAVNANPYTGLRPFQGEYGSNIGEIMVSLSPYSSEAIKELIGNIRQHPKSNVYIGDDKVLKTYDDFNEFSVNNNRSITASDHSYGPQFYSSGRLPNGKFYIVTKKLNTLKNLDELNKKEKEAFYNQLSKGLKNMHKEGKHTHGDIHMGNVLYDDTKDGRKYVWNDFDKGADVAKTKTRKKLQLKIELKQLKNIRPNQINL